MAGLARPAPQWHARLGVGTIRQCILAGGRQPARRSAAGTPEYSGRDAATRDGTWRIMASRMAISVILAAALVKVRRGYDRARPRRGHCQGTWRVVAAGSGRRSRSPSCSALSHACAHRTSVRIDGARGARFQRRSVPPSGGFTSCGSMYFTPSMSTAT